MESACLSKGKSGERQRWTQPVTSEFAARIEGSKQVQAAMENALAVARSDGRIPIVLGI